MAGSLLSTNGLRNENTREFVVETVEEIQYLPTITEKGSGPFKNKPGFNSCAPIGSTCIVGNGGADILVYMLFSNGWKEI